MQKREMMGIKIIAALDLEGQQVFVVRLDFTIPDYFPLCMSVRVFSGMIF